MPLTSTARYFSGRLHAAAVVIGLAILLSVTLADLLARVEPAPRDLVDLAGRQLQMGLLATVVGAGSGATLAARHRRRAGHDHWVTATTPPLRRCLVQFSAGAAPVLAGWLVFLAVTSVRLGAPGQLPVALAVFAMSAVAAPVGVAFGQVVGQVFPALLAAPCAVAGAYTLTVVVAAGGDDSWWQWLGPGFGDGLAPRPRVTWIAGETLWFLGLTTSLLLLAALAGSRPRSLPRRPAAAAAVLLAAGLVLLAMNGPDATTGTVAGTR